jgi:uncharacterized membrane protein SirB2
VPAHDGLSYTRLPMSFYLLAKTVHVTCVVLSISGFVVRFALARVRPDWLRTRIARVAPHVNDTLLLAAAIAMLVAARFDVLAMPWLGGKIAGLVAYIVLGSLALKRGRTQRIRNAAFAGALAAFAYVVSVAITKSLAGPFARLLH